MKSILVQQYHSVILYQKRDIEMIDVIIVDDEVLNIIYLKKILEDINEIRILNSFTEPFEAIDYIAHHRVDLVFLDIELPDINGLDCAINMQDIQNDIKIVFITAYSHYAIEAFKVHALHYLLKPVKQDQILEIINYLRDSSKIEYGNTENRLNTKVYFFGKFRIFNSNDEEIKWPTKKTAELCAYFILNSDRKLQKFQICEDIWPDISEERSSQNFHVTLFRLRQILNTEGIPIKIIAIKGSNEGYICDIKSIINEQEEYIKLLNINNKTRIEDVKVILSSIQGGFLEENYFTWSEKIQHQVNTELINRVHQLIREIENENRSEAISITKLALRIYKIEESLMIHYFNLLLKDNEVYQIIQEFDKYKKMLKSEYNLSPSPELISYVKKII